MENILVLIYYSGLLVHCTNYHCGLLRISSDLACLIFFSTFADLCTHPNRRLAKNKVNKFIFNFVKNIPVMHTLSHLVAVVSTQSDATDFVCKLFWFCTERVYRMCHIYNQKMLTFHPNFQVK